MAWRWRWRWRRRNFEREMAEELRAHVEHRADDLEAEGLSRSDALRQARVELGTVETYKEAIRDERSLGRLRRFVEQTISDLRQGTRRLCKAPLFALFAIGSIALGAGVTTAMFSVVYEVFWASSGIRNADDVALLANRRQGAPSWDRAMSMDDFEDYRRTQTSFEALVAAAGFSQSLAVSTGTELVSGEAVSADYFDALGTVDGINARNFRHARRPTCHWPSLRPA